MVVRRSLQCVACQSIVVTRTQIGHGDSQTHEFACPTCGVPISFVVDLDQEKGGYKYREPRNGKWVDTEKAVVKTLTFSADLAVPGDLGPLSPFIANIGKFQDPGEYALDEAARQEFIKADYDDFERLRVHFERERWDLFDKSAPADAPEDASRVGRAARLHGAYEGRMSFFVQDTPEAIQRVENRIAEADGRPERVSELAAHFLKSGRMLKLWTEIAGVRAQVVKHCAALQVVIQIRYWKTEYQKLDGLAVSTKAYDVLRQLYIDAFETLGRLLAIVGGVEGIIGHDSGRRSDEEEDHARRRVQRTEGCDQARHHREP